MLRWIPAVLLGMWLSLSAVWPCQLVALGQAHFLWQPLLLLSVLLLIAWWQRRVGWRMAAARGLLLYSLMNFAAWLPSLRTSHYWTEYPYPHVYGYYLYLYEGVLAAIIGAAAFAAVGTSLRSWWTAAGWSRPLVVAPLLMLAHAAQAGQWAGLLIGLLCGIVIAWVRPWRWRSPVMRACAARPRLMACLVFLLGALLVYGSAMRIYAQTGEAYASASDDGIHYLWMGTAMAQDPGLFFTPNLRDIAAFTGYYPVMALWFIVAGMSMPLWLVWHGVAGGVLAVAVFWLGRRLMGTAGGLVAAGLVLMDRIMLHLMGTLNMETFMVPTLYVAMVLWIKTREHAVERQWRMSLVAGLVLGIATVFRSTSVLLPAAMIALCVFERPRLRWARVITQSGWMCAGFSLPMLLLYIRNWMAWGYWTLGGERFGHGMRQNYALTIGDHNLVDIGVVAWLRLLAEDPGLIWRHMIPSWWAQLLNFWTHPGFGQMDLVHGLNHVGPYQAMLDTCLLIAGLVGASVAWRQRSRCAQTLLMFPLYFTSLVLVFFVLNSRYRAPIIPALYLLCCLGVWSVWTTTRNALR